MAAGHVFSSSIMHSAPTSGHPRFFASCMLSCSLCSFLCLNLAMFILVFFCNSLLHLVDSLLIHDEPPMCILVSCAMMIIGIRLLACLPVGIPTESSRFLSYLMFKVAQREDLAMHP